MDIVADFKQYVKPYTGDNRLPDSVHDGFMLCIKILNDPQISDEAKREIIKHTVEHYACTFRYYTNHEYDQRYRSFVFDMNELIREYKITSMRYEFG